jgi:DMSO/TMAO reductase YedYZ heme-binding membrane subunit
MANQYAAIVWNRQKRRYDRIMLILIVLYLFVFVGMQVLLFPGITGETLVIRATGSLAFLMLHLVLSIGPLARLDQRFAALLYNRRHLGVTLFLIAAVHGIFNMLQFHSLGNVDPLVSLFGSNTQYFSLVNFPFQVLGFFALLILFLMAATSHDFWLKNLGPGFWKSMHMLVYGAYALLVMHVMLGVIQLETSPVWAGLTGLGMVGLVGLHLLAGRKASLQDRKKAEPEKDGFFRVAQLDEIEEGKAKLAVIGTEQIAIYQHKNTLYAVSNLCRHQHKACFYVGKWRSVRFR